MGIQEQEVAAAGMVVCWLQAGNIAFAIVDVGTAAAAEALIEWRPIAVHASIEGGAGLVFLRALKKQDSLRRRIREIGVERRIEARFGIVRSFGDFARRGGNVVETAPVRLKI